MSVGGRVLYTRDLGEALQVVTWETDSPHQDGVAVDLEKTPEAMRIEPGDMVWWQGPWAFWTSRGARLVGDPGDIKIPRVGYSYNAGDS